ncbi:MAG: M1 family aminopeptidase [Ferruginibacter sp.]
MKFTGKKHLLVCCSILLCTVPLFAKNSDNTHSTTVKHIDFDLRFSWQKKHASGIATLSIQFLRQANTLTLDAAHLVIHTIKDNAGNNLSFSLTDVNSNDNLLVKLKRTYKRGEQIKIAIDYTTGWINTTDPNNIGGSNGKGIRFFEPSSTEPNRRKQVWSMGEDNGNRYWFPCHDRPGELLTTSFKATVDTPFVVISNGELAVKKINADGTVTYHYKTNIPYPNHKTAFVIGEYVTITNKFRKTAITNYAYPDEKEATAATTDRLTDMMQYFSSTTGQAYPFPSYTQVFVQELPWGYSSNTLSIQTENMVDDRTTHADYLYLWDMLEGESLAGQWFGNFVSAKDWKHYWLDKAFSRYFSCLYNEYKNGRDEFLLYQLSFDQANYFNDWNNNSRMPVVPQKITDTLNFINGNYPNSRGALVLHMLRHELGEEKWKQSVRQYVKANAAKPAGTNDLIQAIKTATGEDLKWFFDQWIYGMGHPVFEVIKKYDNVKKELTLTVKQLQQKDTASSYPQTMFFRGKMKIAINNRPEEVFIKPVYENKFSFTCPREPLLVSFDHENTWIKELKFDRTTTELLYQLENDQDVLGKRTALVQLAAIAMDSITGNNDKEKIYSGIRQLITGNNYWRIRYIGLITLQNIFNTVSATRPLIFDEKTKLMLLDIIKRDSSWVLAGAVSFLGATADKQYDDLYISLFKNKSERVVNAAAIALGKTKSSKAFEALTLLKDKSSWKNQHLISAINGFRELGDERAVDVLLPYVNASRLPHWTLATATWDHRLAATETLVRLGAANKAYPLISKDLNEAITENNVNDIFYNLLQITKLAEPEGQQAFDELKTKFNADPDATAAINNLETVFKQLLQKQ